MKFTVETNEYKKKNRKKFISKLLKKIQRRVILKPTIQEVVWSNGDKILFRNRTFWNLSYPMISIEDETHSESHKFNRK